MGVNSRGYSFSAIVIPSILGNRIRDTARLDPMQSSGFFNRFKRLEDSYYERLVMKG